MSSVKDEIQTALGSIGRVKIIACLARKPQEWQSTYSIAKSTRLDRTKLTKNVIHLINAGWVEVFQLDNSNATIRKYRVNLSNPNAARFVRFLNDAGYYDEDDTSTEVVRNDS